MHEYSAPTLITEPKPNKRHTTWHASIYLASISTVVVASYHPLKLWCAGPTLMRQTTDAHFPYHMPKLQPPHEESPHGSQDHA
jgi:hypothetical protein